MKRIYLIVSFILITDISIGQSYNIGLNPPSIQWEFIENDAVKIIYPEGIYGKQHVLPIPFKN